MAIAHSTSKVGSGRNQRKRAGQKSAARADSDAQSLTEIRLPMRIPGRLRVFLGSERDAFIKVQSLLVCVTTAMEVEHGATGPYYPDVLGLAADLLRRRVVNFDNLLLDGVLPADLDQACRGD